jgi:methylisocitrate lyase
VLPGVFCPLVARLAERQGFRGVYLSGAAFSASLGLPDIGLVTAAEFADEARRIAAATELPLLCDADTGFGEALAAERTVRLYESAGAAGLHLEDQVLPKRCGHLSGKQLVDADAMCAKLRAAVAARRDPGFVLVARTDARGVSGYADAVDRARRYLDAGADAVFPEALETPQEFEWFARDVPAPLLANLTEFGKTPPLDAQTLGDMGYKMVIFPVSAFRSALKAAERTLQAIRRDGHPRATQPDMLTRQELYDHLGYDGYETRDRSYFGGGV